LGATVGRTTKMCGRAYSNMRWRIYLKLKVPKAL
jgi:hypothetical protein